MCLVSVTIKLSLSSPLTTFMIPKCHFAKLMPPCNPKVYGVVAVSLTPRQLASSA